MENIYECAADPQNVPGDSVRSPLTSGVHPDYAPACWFFTRSDLAELPYAMWYLAIYGGVADSVGMQIDITLSQLLEEIPDWALGWNQPRQTPSELTDVPTFP